MLIAAAEAVGDTQTQAVCERSLEEELSMASDLERQLPSLTRQYLKPFGSSARERLSCPYRKSNPGILMMQSAQDWLADNTPGCIGGAWYRCILVQ